MYEWKELSGRRRDADKRYLEALGNDVNYIIEKAGVSGVNPVEWDDYTGVLKLEQMETLAYWCGSGLKRELDLRASLSTITTALTTENFYKAEQNLLTAKREVENG